MTHISISRMFTGLAMIALVLLVTSSGYCETKIITTTGEYTMGEGETMLVAKERAVTVAMRNAAEQAGVYVESYSQTQNMELTKDEVNIIAAGLIEVADKKFSQRLTSDGGVYFSVTITARVNSDNIETLRKNLRDKVDVEDYRKIQADYERVQKENEILKQRLASARTVQEKAQTETALKRNEGNFNAVQWFEKGLKAYYTGATKDALAAFSKAIESDDTYAQAYAWRGNVYRRSGLLGEAIKDLTSALELNPDTAYILAIRAATSVARFDFAGAQADCSKAIGLGAWEDPVACHYIGSVYSVLRQYDNAIKFASRAIALSPNNSFAYDTRGRVYLLKEQYDRAIAEYTQALAVNPQSQEALTWRAAVYFSQQQYDMALTDCNQAIAVDPNYSQAYMNRGLAYLKKGMYGLASSDFDKAIETATGVQLASAYNIRGYFRVELKQYQTSISDFDKAIEISPRYAEPYYNKGVALMNLYNSKEVALQYFGLAIQFSNDSKLTERAKKNIRYLGGTP
ncbi:MAG: tetratricopeptide repeat protein [Negativicutes bacterium]|nr:tetratricopeptide repeat protein [Negativicutes bacterium]